MKNISIIGAAIVDVLVPGAEASVFLSGSHPSGEITLSHGGDALNEATVLRRLGAPVRLESLVGCDEAGVSVLRRMERVGLSTRFTGHREDLATSVNVVLVKPDGERSFLTNPAGSQRMLRAEDISLPFDGITEIMCFASIFVFPKIGPTELEGIFRRAHEAGVTVCADMTRPKRGESLSDMAPALKYVDYLFANGEEAMALSGSSDPRSAAEALFSAGAGCVVVKLGAEGCLLRCGEGLFSFPADKAERCVDTTGAGDSFAAGFLWALAMEKPLFDCIRCALYCGARAVEHMGATRWTETADLRLP